MCLRTTDQGLRDLGEGKERNGPLEDLPGPGKEAKGVTSEGHQAGEQAR